jgi:hypothetical protein
LLQTDNGNNTVHENGAAVFFPSKSRRIFYAFSNKASRGALIKVINPANKRTVYVKVLGPLPATKQYANAVIGISASARSALGALENRVWCELVYAGY